MRLSRGTTLIGISVAVAQLTAAAGAQRTVHPVHWGVTHVAARAAAAGTSLRVTIHASIASGWHLYATDEPEGGPIATEFSVPEDAAVDLLSVSADPPLTDRSAAPDQRSSFYAGRADFVLHMRREVSNTAKAQPLAIAVRYQACNSRMCLPPRSEMIPLPGTLRSDPLRERHRKSQPSP